MQNVFGVGVGGGIATALYQDSRVGGSRLLILIGGGVSVSYQTNTLLVFTLLSWGDGIAMVIVLLVHQFSVEIDCFHQARGFTTEATRPSQLLLMSTIVVAPTSLPAV